MLGIDLVYIPEFQEQLITGGTNFIDKTFLVSEMKNRQPEHLAGLWAAKEAVVKAGGKAPAKWTDIIISRDPSGKPEARIGQQHFELSIAHHGDYAVAVAYRVSQ